MVTDVSASSSFEFATATRVLFGPGRLAEAPEAIRGLGGSRVLLVTGANPTRARPLQDALERLGLGVTVFSVDGEPTVERAREGTARIAEAGCDAVVALGGGSALDAGKAIAALAANGGDPLDYLEVIGRGQPLTRPSLPFMAIPTTAGTGSEVTRNAVLGSKDAKVKASLRSPHMLPRVALVDPDLLSGAPAAVLASSGMDALSQLIEPFLSARANPLTDALAREGLRRSARSLRRAVLDGADAPAREDLALASLFGGLCLANAGLGAVHGFAAPVGGMFDAPHGAVCAALLPAVLDVNLRALRARAPTHPSLPRVQELAVLLTGRADARAEDAVAWVDELRAALGVPGLGRYGLTEAQVPALVTKAKGASSMKANPLVLTDAELAEIASRSL
ncbi:iron-containing alcohol dehydrogenase [Myxococcus xanthus]|uniref:Alcohol dehydrogenase n=1 Tax=Myxococcus xanthus TaxID=34 RepID=A0AAE6FZ26_MYXXA|nr:iron-containing alcohol dehydrogenase [Myxococcus xanthus]QDE67985.1 alcohol dehydrogenase [Myxococcus xanthus]QDE75262.1 alcohol dehydrogenase [Myxococcus xanthus]QDE82565.1 alcohol dehydrogenase [Myxococcus xanthus]QDF04365.1 alcohol dehydrogenase [Myxococcus xanthus]